jgi:hypothetical protein
MRTILNIGRSLAFFGAENKLMGGKTLMGKGVLLSAVVTEYSGAEIGNFLQKGVRGGQIGEALGRRVPQR